MVSGKKQVKQGKHGVREDATLSLETVRLLKTQDAGYLRVMGDKVRKDMERLEREVNLQNGISGALDGDGDVDMDMDDDDDSDTPRVKKGGKMLFVDSVDEQRRKTSKPDSDEEDEDEDEDEDDDGDLVDAAPGKIEERKTQKQIDAEKLLLKKVRAARRMKTRAAESRLRKLEALKKQHRDIVAAERELEWQRAKMENSVGGVNKNGLKWKVRERKR